MRRTHRTGQPFANAALITMFTLFKISHQQEGTLRWFRAQNALQLLTRFVKLLRLNRSNSNRNCPFRGVSTHACQCSHTAQAVRDGITWANVGICFSKVRMRAEFPGCFKDLACLADFASTGPQTRSNNRCRHEGWRKAMRFNSQRTGAIRVFILQLKRARGQQHSFLATKGFLIQHASSIVALKRCNGFFPIAGNGLIPKHSIACPT